MRLSQVEPRTQTRFASIEALGEWLERATVADVARMYEGAEAPDPSQLEYTRSLLQAARKREETASAAFAVQTGPDTAIAMKG
ncbi:MAG TPA: hypothetical protein VH482_07150 [Thermomicrobiales bacterium]|jgi:hypothetical protein